MRATGSDAGQNEAVPSTVSDNQKRNEAQSREAVIAEAQSWLRTAPDDSAPHPVYRLRRETGMSVKAVFVYEDGTVGSVELKQEVSVYSRALPAPVAALSAVGSMPVSIPRIDYERRGRMFDGRPVYTAPGFDVKEAAIVSKCEPRIAARVDEWHRADLLLLAKRAHGAFIPLDSWEGDAAQPHEAEELRATNLLKRGARFLCAVRV